MAAPWLLAHTLLATGFTAGVGTLLLMTLRRLSGGPLFGYASRTPTQD